MNEMVPPPLGASPTAQPMPTRPDHMLRLYDALREHSGFTARFLPGALVITHSGYAVATDADRIHLPANAPFTVFSYAVGMLLGRHPHIPAIRAWQHDGRTYLEPVEILDAPATARNTTG